MLGIFLDTTRTLSAKPSRTLSQGTGMALGACVFVLALGLGETITGQVDERFDVVKATTVMVTTGAAAPSSVASLDDFVAPDRLASTAGIAGVLSASRYATVPQRQVAASVNPALPPGAPVKADVLVADSSVLVTAGAVVRGHSLNSVDDRESRDVALLGRALAHTLGITQPGAQIRVGAASLNVIGIIDDTTRVPEALRSVVVGAKAAALAFPGAKLQPAVVVTTKPGAAQVVAANLALMLNPEAPDQLSVSAPLSPEQLHRKVSSDVRNLSIGGALVVLVAGIFAVGNLMLLSITQRIPEIGMRRAMGAGTAQVLGMVLMESLLVGLVAGVLGSIVGLWIILGTSIANHWTPVFDLNTLWVGIAAGCVGGVVGGLVPAMVAARVHPAEALLR